MHLTTRRPFLVLGTLLLGAGLLPMAVLRAQSTTVIGTVVHQNNRPAATVLVRIGSKYVYTDSAGRYRIDGVPTGAQSMQISSGRTVLLKAQVTIRAGLQTINQRVP